MASSKSLQNLVETSHVVRGLKIYIQHPNVKCAKNIQGDAKTYLPYKYLQRRVVG